jgi:hypothetical protein
MLLPELLLEKISLSANTKELQQLISSTIANSAKQLFNQHQDLIYPESKELYFEMLKKEFEAVLTTLLEDYSFKLTQYKTKIIFTKIAPHETTGKDQAQGRYLFEGNVIKLTSDFLGQLANLYQTDHLQTMHGPQTKSGVLMKLAPLINSKINDIVHTYFHELTHVIQLQQTGTDELATSYMTNNRIEVYLAKLDLTIQKNIDIYFGQPEEIAAYAQQYVIKAIAPYTNSAVATQVKFVKQLLDGIKNKSIQHTYSAYGDNNDPRFVKVYRRFLTQLYKEFHNYLQHIHSNN